MQYMYMYIYLLRSGSQRQREVGDWVSLGVQLILNIPKKRGYHHASREHYTAYILPLSSQSSPTSLYERQDVHTHVDKMGTHVRKRGNREREEEREKEREREREGGSKLVRVFVRRRHTHTQLPCSMFKT